MNLMPPQSVVFVDVFEMMYVMIKIWWQKHFSHLRKGTIVPVRMFLAITAAQHS